jgi:ADP-ribose pyrophosphatase
MMEIPQVVASDRKFDGKMIGVRVDTLRLANGTSYTREVVEYGVAVVLVPVDGDGRLLMVRQYRHPTGAWLLELPAGGVDATDASPEAAALRELREETGHRGTLTRIGGMYLAPGYSEEYQHVYAATDLVEDALDADDDEDLVLERTNPARGSALARRQRRYPRREERRRAAHVLATHRPRVSPRHGDRS